MPENCQKVLFRFVPIAVVLFTLVAMSGCAKLRNLNQLLTLKSLADEQASLDDYVDFKNEQFADLVAKVKNGSIAQYKTREEVENVFGEPIYVKLNSGSDQTQTKVMYREFTKKFGSDKVYLYFDRDNMLIRGEFVKGQSEGE